MSNAAVPVYFEESWAILSSIGLVNVLFGLMIIGIATLSPLALVPTITSCAGAIANGLCYYAFYAHYAPTGTVVAAAVADACWLVSLMIRIFLRRHLSLTPYAHRFKKLECLSTVI